MLGLLTSHQQHLGAHPRSLWDYWMAKYSDEVFLSKIQFIIEQIP